MPVALKLPSSLSLLSMNESCRAGAFGFCAFEAIYHWRYLNLPVGISTKTSLPARLALMMASWCILHVTHVCASTHSQTYAVQCSMCEPLHEV